MRIIFGVGTGLDQTGKMIGDVQAEEMENTAIQFLARRFGGVFRIEGKGAWIDDGGKLIAERGVQFVVETDADGGIQALEAGKVLRRIFNRTSVIVSVSQSATVLAVQEKAHAS